MSLRHWLGFLGLRKLRHRVGFMDTGQDREDDGERENRRRNKGRKGTKTESTERKESA